jgi:hypothetical protein
LVAREHRLAPPITILSLLSHYGRSFWYLDGMLLNQDHLCLPLSNRTSNRGNN